MTETPKSYINPNSIIIQIEQYKDSLNEINTRGFSHCVETSKKDGLITLFDDVLN